MFRGKEFQRDAPAKDMLVLNKSSLRIGTKKLFPGVSVVGLVTRGRLREGREEGRERATAVEGTGR